MAAKKKEETEETGKDKVSDSRGLLSGLLKTGKDLHYNAITPQKWKISWGSLQLDSIVKIISGSQIRLMGKGAELGKTSQTLVLIKNYLETVPKSKGLFVDAETRLSDDKKKNCGLKFVDNEDDWAEGTVFILKSNVFEFVAGTLEALLTGMYSVGEHLVFAIDSLDALISNDDLNKELWKVGSGAESVRVASVPSLLKILLKRLSHKIVNYDALAIYTSQYTSEIKLDPYSRTPSRQVEGSGGNAINHQSDCTITYQPIFGGDIILQNPKGKYDPEKNKKLGHYCTVELKKTSNETTGTKVRIPIQKGREGSQIWIEKEVESLLIPFGLCKRKGAWYSFTDEKIKKAKEEGVEIQQMHQGVEDLNLYLEKNKNVFDWLYKELRGFIYS